MPFGMLIARVMTYLWFQARRQKSPSRPPAGPRTVQGRSAFAGHPVAGERDCQAGAVGLIMGCLEHLEVCEAKDSGLRLTLYSVP